VIEITASTAGGYLLDAGRIGRAEPVVVEELPGGVSNVVLLVTLPARGERFVLKQARGKLRVQEDWRCSIERIWREVEVLRICKSLLAGEGEDFEFGNKSVPIFPYGVPDLLWEDRENFLYAMTAAPRRHRTWKAMLLAGETKFGAFIAAACGRMLGRLHAGSWTSGDLARRLEDRTFFDALRLDPYYRHAARVHADRAGQLHQLIDSVWSHRLCLVHGDFSPKNLLVWKLGSLLIDFEVGHYGDPAFDLGFFLTHLVAKAVRAREHCRQYLQLAGFFWREYRAKVAAVATADELADLKRRMMLNLAGCLLARADGKSPLEYLTPEERNVIRTLGREWLVTPPDRLAAED
jgi:aminoglycoside phosphotransferase (APT) family kinase protein